MLDFGRWPVKSKLTVISQKVKEPVKTKFRRVRVCAAIVLGLGLSHNSLPVSAATIMATNEFWAVTDITGGGSNFLGTLQAPFGNSTAAGDYNTDWPANTTWFIDKQVDLSSYDLSSVTYSIAIDNDYYLFVNGLQVGSLVHEGLAQWSPFATLPNIHSGINDIALTIVDRGGLTYFGMDIDGNLAVPEPSTAAFLGMGILGLMLSRKRAS